MKINSLGVLTNMKIVGADTQFIEQQSEFGEYVIVHTPSNPDYFWGNYVIFSSGYLPKESEQLDNAIAYCKAIFTKSLTPLYPKNTPPSHVTFAWDITDIGDNQLSEASRQRMQMDDKLDITQMLAFSPTTTLPINTIYEFRPLNIDNHLATGSDWQQLIESKIAQTAELYNIDETIDEKSNFIDIRYTFYREKIANGEGSWFGAFDNGTLVANFGIVTVDKPNGGQVARFQEVETHKAYRQQGICRNLICYAINQYMKQSNDVTFCIETESGSNAERVYRSVGFEPTEVLYSYCHYDAKF